MIFQWLQDNAGKAPDSTAIVYGDMRKSYAELLSETTRFAGALASLGVSQHDAVAIVLPNVPEFVTSFMAIGALGAVAVPLNPQFKDEELEFFMEDCNVRVVITDTKTAGLCRNISHRSSREFEIILTDTDAGKSVAELIDTSTPADVVPAAPDDELVYLYSSGSTGLPKRVPKTHKQSWWEAEDFITTTRMTVDDNIFCAVPLYHAHGLGNCMFAALHSGATLVIHDKQGPFVLGRKTALNTLQAEGVTVFPGVPFIFQSLAELPGEENLPNLRLCFSAGSPLPEEIYTAFRERYDVPVRQLYGCTEAGSVTINTDPDPAATRESVGCPMHNVEIIIADETGRQLASGETGEVIIRSPALTTGYYNRDELNREVFRDGGYYTGDTGFLDETGHLYVTGRKKRFIEVAGNKVDPAEVEEVLMKHPDVREVVVVGTRDASGIGEHIKAVVVAEGDVEERALIEFCASQLANYKLPEQVEFRDEIPKSPLGKILRKYLV